MTRYAGYSVSISRPSSFKQASERRRGRTVALSLVLAWLVSWAGPAWAGVADQVGATFGLMLHDVVSAFPAVEGFVVAVDGEQLYMDLTQKEGVQPGQEEFTIFRKGEVFRHPITGRPMGRFEDLLGYAQVKRVLPRFSEAVYVTLPGKPEAQPEDGVRITRGRIRVAVEELLVRPERAVATAKTLEVSGWLVPVLLERRGVTYLDVTWVSGITGTAIFSRRLALIRAETAAEQRFPWEPVPED